MGTLLHPEIGEWLLMSSFKSPMLVSGMYVACLLFISKVVVNGRDIQNTIDLSRELLRFVVYIGAVFNWGLLIFFFVMSVRLEYNFLCEPPSKSLVQQSSIWSWLTEDSSAEQEDVKKLELLVASGMWWFLIAKMIDLLDHVALALRNDPVRAHQVAHHIVMVMTSWFALKYAPGGSTIIFVILNCAYLAIAYSWQILTNYSPGSHERYLFWQNLKPLVNLIKILQFFLVGLHSVTIINSKCPYPSKYAFFVLGFVSLVIFLAAASTDGFGSGGGGGGGGRGNRRSARNESSSDDDDDDDNPKTGPANTAPTTTTSNPENPPTTSGDQSTTSSDKSQEAPKSGDDSSAKLQAFHIMPSAWVLKMIEDRRTLRISPCNYC